MKTNLSLCAAVVLGLASGSVLADPILAPGIYELNNHPDGNQNPPLYGARFDELYNVTGSHDVFTLDFDHPLSAVYLTVTSNSLTISGVAFGGRDTGGSHANDSYLGLYTLNFTYSLGVTQVPGDDDIHVNTANHANTGSILTPLGHTISLADERSSGYSFRLGNENNDLGHRGFSGVSGWGWMSYGIGSGNYAHTASTDWLFTVGPAVPTPGAAAILGLGSLFASRRNRR